MKTTKEEELREEFIKKEWQHWSSAQSKFVRLPDSCKMEIAYYWLQKRREAIAEERERVNKAIEKTFWDILEDISTLPLFKGNAQLPMGVAHQFKENLLSHLTQE